MAKMKFYRSKNNPTIILDRSWTHDANEIDKALKKLYGKDAKWSQIFAYGEIANNIYCLFKEGHRKFNLDKIYFRYSHGSIYTVNLATPVIHAEGKYAP